MKILEEPWNEKIDKKKLIEADITCKMHSKKYITFCTKCFQLNCDLCEKSHINHNLFKLKNLFLYYKTDNHACKDDDAFRTILYAGESYDKIITWNKNIDEKELKSSYINFLENNVPIYKIYRELYNSYFGKKFIKNDFYFLYDHIINTKFLSLSKKFEYYILCDKRTEDEKYRYFMNLYKTTSVIRENTPYLRNIINIKYGIKNIIHKGIEFNYERPLCGSDEVMHVKEVKLFITAVAQLDDNHLLIVSNENTGQIFFINNEYFSLIKEIKLSSKFILPLKKPNYLFSSEGNNKHEEFSYSFTDNKKSSFILRYNKSFSFSNVQKIDIPSNFAVESNDGRIFISKMYVKNIQVLKINNRNKYEKIFTISSKDNVYGKPFVYKEKYLIYPTEHELVVNDLNENKLIKSFEIEDSFGNGEMRAVKENILVVIIYRGFSLYNMEKLEFIKYITQGYDYILSRNLCIVNNGILLVGHSSGIIGVYDINDDFK